MKKDILLSIDHGVATLKLNRPDVFNSFNRAMALQLQDELDQCAANNEVRALVITGSGKAFCAGQDLQEVTSEKINPGFRKILEEHYNPIIQKIRRLKKPVVAAVNGVAAGAGANIALACDIVIASEQASFIQAFTKIGLVPDSGGSFFLPRLIGIQRASALMLLGDKLNAEEALAMGLLYKMVAHENLEKEVLKVAKTLAAMPTKALGMTKELINASMTNTLDQQLHMESEYQIEAAQTQDYKEGVSAFMEKRTPIFKGK